MSEVLLNGGDMKRTVGRMAHEILEAHQGAQDLVVIGVLKSGWPIAKRLAFAMTQVEGTTIPCGKVDARKFRDDLPETSGDDSEIPFEVEGKVVILVDEVIFTGRTVRAAIDAVLAFGRPKKLELAVLIDRGHRELPIQPDYCGREVMTDKSDHIDVRVTENDGDDSVVLIEGAERLTNR